MLVLYRPEGQEEQRFEFRPGQLRLSEQAQVEKIYRRLTGDKKSFLQVMEDMKEGDAVAVRVVLHFVLKRVHPVLRIEDVDPTGDEVEIRYSRAELEEVRDNIASAPDFPEKEMLLARLDMDIAMAPDDNGEPGKATGSASAATSDSAAGPSRRRGRNSTSN